MYLFKTAIDSQVSDLQKMLGLGTFTVDDKDEMKLSPLHHAAWYNKPEAVDALLKYGADIHALDAQNATPLHYAARYKQRVFTTATGEVVTTPSINNVVSSLLTAGAEVNPRDIYGDTPLFLAVVRGNEDAVEELLKAPGIDVESPDNRGLTTLHVAAKFNRVSIARRLLKVGATIRVKNDRKSTPMHLAAMEGNIDIMKMFIDFSKGDQKELINEENSDNESPLDLAIENRHLPIARLLLDKGATVNKICRDTHSSPMHIAASAGDIEICRLLLEKDKFMINMRNVYQGTPLHRAAQYDRPKVVALLLDWKAHIDARDQDNCTPLLTAVQHGSKLAVDVLIEHGAELSALTKGDQSVIHIAAENNKVETLQILLSGIAKQSLMEQMISADNRLGNSPLHLAAGKGLKTVVKLLLENGADRANKNEDEETALHVAAENGKTAIVMQLLHGTASGEMSLINDTDEDSNTPLHLASAEGHVKTIQTLLEAGADITHRNRQHWTPLASAAERGWTEAVKTLLTSGAEVSPRDRSGNTPLMLAAQSGHDRVVNVLLYHKAPVSIRDTDGNNVLDIAIKYGHSDVAMTIIRSDQWEESLRNRQPCKKKYEPYTTPLRKLIRKMPDVVEKVFDNCVTYPKGMDLKDPELQIDFNFEFLDDTYSCAMWGDPKLVRMQNISGKAFDAKGELLPRAYAYTKDSVERTENHPLVIMVKSQQIEQLYHPLVLALLRHKWRLAKVSYFSFLIFYAIFVSIFTSYMVFMTPPFMFNESYFDYLDKTNNSNICSIIHTDGTLVDIESINSSYQTFATIVVWIMASIGILIEGLQFYSTPSSYLWSPTNVLDWYTYVSSIVVVAPLLECGIKTHWQWQLGASCMFIAWIDIILFLRRLPGVGIYIVMVGEVFITFVKFFFFCFSLFIFAFGFTFYVLLRNQDQFQTPAYSFVKTMVMMVGEMDFGDIFHIDEEEGFSALVFYETISYFLFIVFLCVVTIIIMNLLTGLAVGDVNFIQEQAKLKKLAMQIELALDVETSLPEFLRRKLHCVIKFQTLQPNNLGYKYFKHFRRFMSGPLSSNAIAKAIYQEAKQANKSEMLQEENEEEAKHEHMAANGNGEFTMTRTAVGQHLVTQMGQTKDRLKVIEDKLQKMQEMFEALMRKSGIELESEEPGEHSA